MILHKTIFQEMSKSLLVIVFSMSIILFMEKFVRLTRIFMGKGADFSDIAKIFVYLQPSILLLSLPMAILVAIFLTYGRMSTDSEIIVLKAGGMSFWGISRAAVMLALLCFAVLAVISLYLLPRSMYAFKHTMYETIVKKASTTFEAETFSDVFKDTVIYVKEIPSPDIFKGIFVYKEGIKSIEEPVVIVAESGVIRANPAEGLIKLSMNNGLIHTYDEKSSSEISFSQYDFVLKSGIETMDKIKPDEIKTIDLWRANKENTYWAIELHRRLALPFACLIFGLLGPALSNKIGKIGRLGGFSLSLVILILYYVLMIFGEGLAKSGEITPFWGGWSPNLIFGGLTMVFVYIAYKDKPIRKL
ncbi:MAG: LPS export ABC transporter permease LptF [Nitrospirota bacterium]